MDSKQALRRTALHRRQIAPSGPDLGQVVLAVTEAATTTAGYVGLPGEPFVSPQPGWLLPVLLPDGDLDWVAYDGTLAVGPRGLREPVGARLGTEAIARYDVVLVPALLVDRRGVRLGRGGGSYDRALARATGLTIALLHDDELVEQLPHEPHDVPVAAVATPTLGVVHFPTY